LSSFIPEDERIITIEDSAELHLHGIPNLVRFEARMETADGVKAITIRDLIKTALRCRPDRVIVGEVRSEEAIDMLQALNIGQDGSMSTIHANSAEDALYRLETIVMLSSEIPLKALRRQIASGIDIIIHLGRLRDKSRRLLEVLEVSGMQENEIVTHPLFTFEETGEENGRVTGELVRRDKLVHRKKLKRAGLDHEL
jgi:pilus assembly protein CpaF